MSKHPFRKSGALRAATLRGSITKTQAVRGSMAVRVLTVVAMLLVATGVRADLHVWTGAAGDSLWSNNNNWYSGVAPSITETAPVILSFPSGTGHLNTSNDISASQFISLPPLSVDAMLVFDNYTFYGAPHSPGLDLPGNPVSFFGTPFENLYCMGQQVVFDWTLGLNIDHTVTITNRYGCVVELQSTLAGPGGWTFEGSGQLYINGYYQNTLAGTCWVQGGVLSLAQYEPDFNDDNYASAISGPLIIGTTNLSLSASVEELDSTGIQFGAPAPPNLLAPIPITILPSGSLNLYGNSPEPYIGTLTMIGGTVLLGAGQGYYDIYGDWITNYGSLTVEGITSYTPAGEWPPAIVNDGAASVSSYQISLNTQLTGSSNPPVVVDVESGSLLVDVDVITVYNGTNVPIAGYTYYMGNPITIPNTNFSPAANLLVKTGPGTLELPELTDFVATTLIQQGTVQAGYNAFGGAATPPTNQIVVFPGAEIVANKPSDCPVPLVLSGYGPGGEGDALDVQVDGVTFYGGVTLVGDSAVRVSAPYGTLNLTGKPPIVGAADLHKHGPGTLQLGGFPGTNELTGSVFVEEGVLSLNSATNGGLLAGALVIGTNGSTTASQVQVQSSDQLRSNAPVTINDAGALVLGSYSQSLESLTLNGGNLVGGNLTLLGDVAAQDGLTGSLLYETTISLGGTNRTFDVAANSTLWVDGGSIADGGNNAGLTKTGAGQLKLDHCLNTYNGVTWVNDGQLALVGNTTPGSALAGTVVADGAELDLADGAKVGLEPLSLTGSGTDGLGALKGTGTNSWAGPITLNGPVTIDIALAGFTTLSGAISGDSQGALIKTDAGTLQLTGSDPNSYPGTTAVQGGLALLAKTGALAVPAGLSVGQAAGSISTAEVRLMGPNQILTTAPVEVDSTGLFNLNGFNHAIGSLSGWGTLNLVQGELDEGEDNGSGVFFGTINGGAGSSLRKDGTGILALLGTGDGTFSGAVYANSGQLLIGGTFPQTTAYVSGGTLGGTGTVGPLSAGLPGGALAPGLDAPGILNSGNLSLNGSDTFVAAINGTNAGSDYAQLNVTGTVSLGNAALQLVLGTTGAISNRYTIINNDGLDAVTGTFAGLAEGATVVANNGVQLTISYQGGTGNDVMLTQTSLAVTLKLGGIKILSGGGIELDGSGAPNAPYTIWANSDLGTTNWVDIGTAQASGAGSFQFTDPGATNFPHRFYRFSPQ